MHTNLNFIGINEVDTELLNEEIEYALYDNLKQMERNNSFTRAELTPLDINNTEFFKFQREKTGEYFDHLGQSGIDCLNEQISQKLHPIF